jgi:hypothetical protein
MQPDVIDLMDKNLTDTHLLKLIDYMRDKEAIKRLNLRRNKITSAGVIALARFIKKHDNTMVEINLNRNRIELKGA